MIKISLKGLAKFMTSSPAGQRKVLHDYKFPNEDEPKAMRLYYGEAVDSIKTYHLRQLPVTWLREQADRISQLATTVTGMSETRLRNNVRGIRQYADNFASRRFTILGDLRLALAFDTVRVTVVPDLHVREGSREKIVKLDFAKAQPDHELIKIITQSMFEALRVGQGSITPSSVLYLDAARGDEHRGARVGSRLMTDIRAACQNIEALWGTITK
ncbi:MAG: hypothetical protein QOH70_1320 [Blastocatellia bacterium]|jgi:hypothetical protein|nr:hypothetical protein [Blastocatellia bacterium]